MLKGELVVYGQQFWRPYIHVVDAARAISLVLDNGPQKTAGAVFNIGKTSENYRKSDLVGLLKARIPRGSVRYVSKQEDPRDYQVSFEKAHQHLGFTTTRTVPDGIDELIALLTSGLLGDPYASVYRN
jgi:nucleoside-diphosphate-sugar epimerase